MTYIMKSETWLDLTKVSMKPRSRELKAIDKALESYHTSRSDDSLAKLKLALHHWKMSKGFDGSAGKPAWMTSERNRRSGVATLDLQVFGVNTPPEASAMKELAELPFYGVEAWAGEGLAKEILKEARKQALPLLFMGRKVVVKKTPMAKAAKKIRNQLDSAKRNASSAASAAAGVAARPAVDAAKQAAQPARDAAETIAREIIAEITQIFPDVADQLIQMLNEMVPNFLAELAAAVAPYLSLVPSGGKAVKNTVQTCISEYKWVKTKEHRVALGAGDPQAAAEALLRMLERERNRHARLAAIYTTDVTVKASSIVADAAAFGAPTVSAVVTPLQGFATSVAVLSQNIFLLARDLHEMRKTNKVLAVPSQVKLSVEIFDKCPLLGCYFIACSNTSDILNFLIEDIGAPGWKFDVETMVTKHIEPLVGYSRDVISSSRLEVDGLQMSKGVVTNLNSGGAIASGLKHRKAKIIGKIKTALPFTEDATDYRVIASGQGHKAVTPDVLKSRITGFGSR